MMGRSHVVAGVAGWALVVPLLGFHGWPVVVGAVVAGSCAHGRLSPDCDRYPLLGRLVPGGHRGLTHWWPVPITGLWAASFAGPYRWLAVAVVVGWASHILGDAVFGRVPLWPRLRRRGRSRWFVGGVGLKTGGMLERWVAVPAFGLTGLLVVLPASVWRYV
jgi:membrane-bound metal-dependent hydrolase YbcI (DUF457 family)